MEMSASLLGFRGEENEKLMFPEKFISYNIHCKAFRAQDLIQVHAYFSWFLYL